ncbi:Histidine triad nucleotide-binding protein 3 [Larimichthys crocea]|uniref:Histidine triad nucleotide-binding protein 3 n=1 Tax=Larimichthys crocea TaxID=215358 RepID=A0A6G0I6C8_LARCR|nr:Histidine triad nucleotide-binding protein 3 [Larimichthys crocea]
MESGRSDPSEEVDQTCIFCLIANDLDKETEILKKDKELMCFRDIYPAAPHHYLVIPIQHIESCHSLHGGHIGLIQRMAEMGKAVLREQGVTNMKDIRLGFHQPPYTSVDHLHLHVLAPSSQISQYMEYKFIPRSYRFLSDKYILDYLNKLPPPVQFSDGSVLSL